MTDRRKVQSVNPSTKGWSQTRRLRKIVVLALLGCISVSAQTLVVSAASYQPALAPGGIATIFGGPFAAGTVVADVVKGQPPPESLGNVSVTVSGIKAGLFFVSSGQINILLPSQLPPGVHDIVVQAPTGQFKASAALSASAFAIFHRDGRAAVLNAFTGDSEPFQVIHRTAPDGRARLALYGEGVKRIV